MNKELGLDELEIKFVMSYKIKNLAKQKDKQGLKVFMSRLSDIHYLSEGTDYESVVRILQKK